jgi:uncharacterized protein involved in exopolysaccharide biosynthesis
MNESQSENLRDSTSSRAAGGDRIYVVTPDMLDLGLGHAAGTGGLFALWQTLWRGKRIVIVASAIVGMVAITYSLMADKWYRAELLMIAAELPTDRGGLADSLGSLGGIVGLAGITLGSKNTAEPLGILQSRQFIGDFIKNHQLMPVLFPDDYNASGLCRWAAKNDCPDKHDAFKKFSRRVLNVATDKKTGLVTVSVEWTDPEVAADWANSLIETLNERMRLRALQEAEASVGYLKVEMEQAKVVPLQQSIGRLLQNEMQKAMLARVTKEFAFRVLDRAEAPKWRVWPKRGQLVTFAVVLAGVLSSIVVLVLNNVHEQRARQLKAKA